MDKIARDPSADREARVGLILQDVVARRSAGHDLRDHTVVAAYPELMPELGERLRELAVVESARRAAELTNTSANAATLEVFRPAAEALPATALPGYEIIREIHRGGQGVVYQAIQKATKRKVAVKVMHEGPFAGPRDRVRFEREVQILATLNHPNVVAIHDSGVTPSGSFYFVMDYISGQPLDDYLASGARPVAEILRLLAKICDAVNAAHLRGVIHRDLKPGNIRIDSAGEPHILDFGLAKVVMGGVTEASHPQLMSVTGQFIGSLPWASPEQALGTLEKIDIRTDVYSLGVIAYQMLTGRFPYEVVGSMRDVLEQILKTEPARPSTIRKQINDEVETIVLKCLQKDRDRRYQSAGELARDIRHYLAGDPIEAKRDSFVYFVRKRMRHYRPHIAVATAFVLLLAAGVVLLAASRQRAAADRDNATRILQFLQGMFAEFEPGRAKKPEVAVLPLLDHAAQRLVKELPDRPEVRAPLHETIGSLYTKIGRYQQAEEHLRTALDMRRRILRPPHPDLARNLYELAAAYWWDGYYARAEPLCRESLQMERELYRSNHREVALALTYLAACRLRLGDVAEAEERHTEALKMRRELFGEDDLDVAASRNNIARCYLEKGDYARAEPLFMDVLATIRRLKPDSDPDVASGLDNVGSCLMEQGKYAEAGRLFEEALEMRRGFLGEDHPALAQSLYRLAALGFAQGDAVRAEARCSEALALQRPRLRERHPEIADSLCLLGRIRLVAGSAAEAEHDLRDALAIRREAIPNHWRTAEAESVLGECLIKQGRFDEAEPLLLRSYPIIRERRGAASPDTRAAVQRLVECYDGSGKSGGDEYRALLKAGG
ncbi:MAG TPA: serine/threonine-protein kinase [Phycisphaerae bacterium]